MQQLRFNCFRTNRQAKPLSLYVWREAHKRLGYARCTPANLLSLPVVLVFGLGISFAQTHAGSTPEAEATAWRFLESAWTTGGTSEKEQVLASLALVRSIAATEIYRDALRSGDPVIAGWAANLASQERVSELLPEIKERLKTESNQFARIQLLTSLGRLGTEEAAELMLPSALEDKQPLMGVSFGVLKGLGEKAVPTLITVLNGGCAVCRETAANLFLENENLLDRGVLRQALGDSSVRVRTLAAAALAERGNLAGFDVLRAAQDGGDAELRVRASIALYNSGNPESLAAVLDSIAHATPEIRHFAVREAIRKGSPLLRNRVLNAAARDESASIRNAALDGLSVKAGDRQRIEAFLADPDVNVRILAAMRLLDAITRSEADSVLRAEWSGATNGQKANILSALSAVGASTPTARGIVEEALRGGDVGLQVAAIHLIKTRGPESIPALLPLLDSENPLVAATAADVLIGVSPSEAARVLNQYPASAKRGTAIIRAGYLLRALEVQANSGAHGRPTPQGK